MMTCWLELRVIENKRPLEELRAILWRANFHSRIEEFNVNLCEIRAIVERLGFMQRRQMAGAQTYAPPECEGG
jgi:hypothetical protein